MNKNVQPTTVGERKEKQKKVERQPRIDKPIFLWAKQKHIV